MPEFTSFKKLVRQVGGPDAAREELGIINISGSSYIFASLSGGNGVFVEQISSGNYRVSAPELVNKINGIISVSGNFAQLNGFNNFNNQNNFNEEVTFIDTVNFNNVSGNNLSVDSNNGSVDVIYFRNEDISKFGLYHNDGGSNSYVDEEEQKRCVGIYGFDVDKPLFTVDISGNTFVKRGLFKVSNNAYIIKDLQVDGNIISPTTNDLRTDITNLQSITGSFMNKVYVDSTSANAYIQARNYANEASGNAYYQMYNNTSLMAAAISAPMSANAFVQSKNVSYDTSANAYQQAKNYSVNLSGTYVTVIDNQTITSKKIFSENVELTKAINVSGSVSIPGGIINTNAIGVRLIQTGTFVDPGGNDGDIVYVI